MISWNYLNEKLMKAHQELRLPPIDVYGKVTRLVGSTIEAMGVRAPIGTCCQILSENSQMQLSEVVGFNQDKLFLMPYGELSGVASGDIVRPTLEPYSVSVGEALLGRVLDGLGKPIDGKGPLLTTSLRPLQGKLINPLDRAGIKEPLDVGVTAINSFITLGKGQRVGLFAGSGVGKSMLLSMMTRFTSADVVVIGLIGERGREVKEFIEQNLGEEGLRRSVVVASPADSTPLQRMNGAYVSTSIAEFFRDQGKQVLLLMDSLTRFAHAQRELGLAIGEPPTTKGYPPSVFTKIPQLIERAGNSQGAGSMTAIYTVLAEGDDQQDPIVDAARAILDGHILLSRKLAELGHYPAIDIEGSISRSMINIVSSEHLQRAQLFRRYHAKLIENQDLLSIGAYVKGVDLELDWAVEHRKVIENFLKQGYHEKVCFSDGIERLNNLLSQ